MNKVFSIVGKLEEEPDNYMMLGTGFFIDGNGLFTTAGHVFRNNRKAVKQFFVCFPEGEEYVDLIPVISYRFYSRKIYGDQERLNNSLRKRFDYQCGPEYFDVGIGKIEMATPTFFEFKKKRPFERDKLTMPCFNRNKKTCPEKMFDLVDGKVNSQYFEFHNWELKLIERLKLARIPFLYETMEFVDNPDHLDPTSHFSNLLNLQ